MKIRSISTLTRTSISAALLTLGLGAMAPAQAAPQLQTCSLMEVMYDGDRSMSYYLPCNAGEWALTYTGSVPAGLGRTTAHYRVEASHPNGAGFSLNRSVVLPSAAHLGQALVREAVLLDDGDLAMSDCKEAGCTTYRPLGALKRYVQAAEAGNATGDLFAKPIGKKVAPPANSLSGATVTVPPTVKILTEQNDELKARVTEQAALIRQQSARIQTLEGEVDQLNALVEGSRNVIVDLNNQLQVEIERAEKAEKRKSGGWFGSRSAKVDLDAHKHGTPIAQESQLPASVAAPVAAAQVEVIAIETPVVPVEVANPAPKTVSEKAAQVVESNSIALVQGNVDLNAPLATSLEEAKTEYIQVTPTQSIRIRTYTVPLSSI